jgi:hypothetical protein
MVGSISPYSWEFRDRKPPRNFDHYYFFTEAIASASMDATPLNIQIIWPQNVPVIGQISKFLGACGA